MLQSRAIPCLLLSDGGLVKTTRFKDPVYLGDPINIVRILNDKEVDELVFLDISASRSRARPSFDLLSQIASEAFVPFGYGGGVRTLDDMQTLFSLGVEKVILNSLAVENPGFVQRAATKFGSQSVVVSIDVKHRWFGREEVVTYGGRKATGLEPVKFAQEMERRGAGEILLTAVDRDGTMLGYDLDLVKRVSSSISVPTVACGGAGKLADLGQAVREGGASAAAAGSIFVFQGPRKGVLISYPTPDELRQIFKQP